MVPIKLLRSKSRLKFGVKREFYDKNVTHNTVFMLKYLSRNFVLAKPPIMD
jgi:hypothetical protein